MAETRQRPSPEVIKARKAEIARRYGRKAKNKKPRTIAAIRISELTRLFDHRYARMYLPESDEALLAVRIMAHHMGALPDAARRIQGWVMTCAPWLGFAERERLISEVLERPLRWRADKLGWKLRLSDAERSKLRISTIGAFDVPKAARDARRKEAKRQLLLERRRAAGAVTRAQYLASQAMLQHPWVGEGISRATWFRRRKGSSV